ncbi:hypothetical protein Tco_0101401, partial [Tanacetum coccineum]
VDKSTGFRLVKGIEFSVHRFDDKFRKLITEEERFLESLRAIQLVAV